MTSPTDLLSREGSPRWVDPMTAEQRASHPALSDGMTRPELWLYPADSAAPILFSAAVPDVYDLLDEFRTFAELSPEWARRFSGAVLFTSGWAAPLVNGEVDGAPSAHPERRRVFLAVCVTREDGEIRAASRMMFPDQCEVIDDPGTATGALADAVAECVASRLGGAA